MSYVCEPSSRLNAKRRVLLDKSSLIHVTVIPMYDLTKYNIKLICIYHDCIIIILNNENYFLKIDQPSAVVAIWAHLDISNFIFNDNS